MKVALGNSLLLNQTYQRSEDPLHICQPVDHWQIDRRHKQPVGQKRSSLSPKWRSVNIASIIGLGTGSIWIGLGVWAYSKFFILPTGETNLSFYAALGWFIWTYFTEIPFLLLLVPPILNASYAAFKNLEPEWYWNFKRARIRCRKMQTNFPFSDL